MCISWTNKGLNRYWVTAKHRTLTTRNAAAEINSFQPNQWQHMLHVSCSKMNCSYVDLQRNKSGTFAYFYITILKNFIFRKTCIGYKIYVPFVSAFAEFGKTTISFVMSVLLSVRTHGITRLPLEGFSWILIFGWLFSENCIKNSSFINIWQE